MADSHHGNTPAAWIGVGVATIGFVLGSVATLRSPVHETLLIIGIVIAAVSFPLFLVLSKIGLNASEH